MNRKLRRARQKKGKSAPRAGQPPRTPSRLQQAETLRTSGRLDEARELCRRIVASEPDNARAVFLLGVVEQQFGKSQESVDLMKRALDLNPDYADAHVNLGVAYRSLGRLKSATKAIRKGLELDPENADAHSIYGAVLAHAGDWAKAEQAYRRALDINPRHARTFNNLGVLMARQERSGEAEDAYRRAVAIRPGYTDARFNLSTVHRFYPGDPEIDALKKELAGDGLSPVQRTKMKFALGKAHDHTGDYPTAFRYFSEANAEMAQMRDFDEDEYRRRMNGIREQYEDKPVRLAEHPANSDHIPIFVVGPSRSGKTLIESMLARAGAFRAGERRDLVQAEGEVAHRAQLRKRFPLYLSLLEPTHLAEIGERYLKKVAEIEPEARCSVNTLPGHYGHVGVILGALANARVIFCRRNAMDCAMRIFFHYYRSKNEHAFDQETVARYYARYWRLLNFWKQRYGERILLVNYEDLVSDTDSTVREIFGYCGFDRVPSADELNFRSDEIDHWRNYERELEPMLQMMQKVAPEALPQPSGRGPA